MIYKGMTIFSYKSNQKNNLINYCKHNSPIIKQSPFNSNLFEIYTTPSKKLEVRIFSNQTLEIGLYSYEIEHTEYILIERVNGLEFSIKEKNINFYKSNKNEFFTIGFYNLEDLNDFIKIMKEGSVNYYDIFISKFKILTDYKENTNYINSFKEDFKKLLN
ncbi:hypothetical protein A0H76_1604 [Hepatospora eriocheir]|uniref:Uncharacterized protein n=1 Tax=Hepatospora eriocheir TaxID=1081669 RepID=A0A1X0QGU4_9MICR|nr:hypothetical protein A0H76_1604 [Hepatospora eriocheir]